ncbi:hypothetical protein ACFLTI_04455 [Bacteroidota bacterium]
MKSKRINLYLILFFICSVLFVNACKKDDVSHNYHPDELVGDWDVVSEMEGWELTTNSDQTFMDFHSEANGRISVTGDYQAVLSYIFQIEGIIVVSENSFSDMYMEENYPLMWMGVFGNDIMLNVFINDSDMDQFIILGADFDLDTVSYTLTVNQLELFNFDQSKSVIIDGTISAAIIDIAANTPTNIVMYEYINDYNMIINFGAEGAFSASFEDEENNLHGMWEVKEDGMLYIIDTTSYDIDTDVDTTIFSYNIISDKLTMILDVGPECSDEDGSEEKEICLREIETFLLLDEGSLMDVSFITIVSFTRSVGIPKYRPVRPDNWKKMMHPQLPDRNNYKSKFEKYFKK